MGKAGRFACIFVPMLLTLGALVCIIIVGLGGTNKSSQFLTDLNVWSVDTKGYNPNFFSALPRGSAFTELKDFYNIYLFNYCYGSIDADGKRTVEFCSKPANQFAFDPVDVWGLDVNINNNNLISEAALNTLNAYKTGSKWVFIGWVVAFALTIATFIVGFFAIFSRWGSFVTTIFANLATTFLMAAAIGSTILAGAAVGQVKAILEPAGIKGAVGTKFLSVAWIAVAFSIVAGLTWLISVCCCSGRSTKKAKNFEKSGGYERVESPYLPPSQPQAYTAGRTTYGDKQSNAYEPFRHS